MPTYLTPGVYIEEVPSGPRPIQPVGTSVAGFVGQAPDSDAFPHQARAVNNWSEFQRDFASSSGRGTALAQAVFGFFLNRGQRCYVVNTGRSNSIAGAARGRKGIDALEPVDEVAIVAAPGHTDAASYESLLSHCERLGNRVAILDAPEEVSDIAALTRVATVSARAPKKEKEEDEPPEAPGLRPRQSDNGMGAVYFPWIAVRDAFDPSKVIQVPPSGHMAGIYALTDATRGVHKAPANEQVRGALDVAYRVTHQEQELLNPKGVNCIRFFPQEGIRAWGARTLAAAASEWRYINVRRLFIMIEESIRLSTRWVVFEPNDMTLWKSINRDISNFLTLLWRDGALLGATPEEAFFVKCDRETNPPESIDAGRVVAVIGIAPVKPAEFIIFRISQSVGAESASEGGQQSQGEGEANA